MFDKPTCKLSGTDGNVFAIIGKVSATLKKAGLSEESKGFLAGALSQESYEDVLTLCGEYVEIE